MDCDDHEEGGGHSERIYNDYTIQEETKGNPFASGSPAENGNAAADGLGVSPRISGFGASRVCLTEGQHT